MFGRWKRTVRTGTRLNGNAAKLVAASWLERGELQTMRKKGRVDSHHHGRKGTIKLCAR